MRRRLTSRQPLAICQTFGIVEVMQKGGALLSDAEPIAFGPRQVGHKKSPAATGGIAGPQQTTFDRNELKAILDLYGRKVAAGDWRDYAIDMLRDRAVFSVFRAATEFPLYRIEKTPQLARKQGAYSVVAAGGLVVKRGHDLRRVLSVLEKRFEVVAP